ncbi:MAG TPA: hypothetical protein VKW77_03215, partial [Acidimicrobiales bacterium]|nr:hypothetical protein [Acidimicrobiales bacterium]
MLDPTADDGGTLGRSSHTGPAASAAPGTIPQADAASPSDDPPRQAADALMRFGPCLGWGLFFWGTLWALSGAIGRVAEGPAAASHLAQSILQAAAVVVASGLAGWAAAVACRLAAATVLELIYRDRHAYSELLGLAPRAIAALERLADARARPPIAAPEGPSDGDRVHLRAGVDQALRSGRHAEAATLLEDFEARFPDDPAIPALRDRLAAALREHAEAQVAQIDAARQVNDSDRVLELFRTAAPALEPDRRGDLERQLAKWFQELIFRRLRGGVVQVEVVHLAAQVAETFGATVEGASLRASLPLLRRSVGLCPQCAQPYTGMARACPKCLAPTAEAPLPATGEPTPPTDPEPEPLETPPADRDGRDDGWLRYNEDDA